MSAQPGRHGKKLLIAGLVLSAVAVLGFFSEAMLAGLFVPICQPGEHWIREGRCGLLWYRVLAMELLFGLGVTLVLLDLTRRMLSRWPGAAR